MWRRIVGEVGPMDRAIARLNIEHYRRLLALELDEVEQRAVQQLLAEEGAKLVILKAPRATRRDQ